MAVPFRQLEEISGRVTFTGGGSVCPTLVIGLGGSGVTTARRVKKILETRYGRLGIIGYLFADTDEGEYAEVPELAEVEPSENASIVARNATQIFAEMKQGLHREIAEFLPEGVDVGILRHADGAGGIRPVGRFALFSQFANFYTNRLLPTCSRLLQVGTLVQTALGGVASNIEVRGDEPRVYIINSVCGGTGSSIFLDVALLTRAVFHQSQVEPTIIGVFYLPSVFRNEQGISPAFREVIQANGYAGLMELEYFCDPYIGRENWTFNYPDIPSVKVEGPLFDECFLIEGTNARGQQLATKLETFEMTARSLCIDIGSPVGARMRSARRNSVTVIHTTPCHETQKFRLMNSFATTGLKVPVEAMAQYCSLQAARAIINDHLIRQRPNLHDLQTEVNTFLSANHLEERGDQNQLLERLLRDPDGNQLFFMLGRTRQQLEEEAEAAGQGGEKGQARYLANWISQKLENLRTVLLPNAQTVINTNKPLVLADATQAIQTKITQCLQTQGLAYCEALLTELVNVISTVLKELTDESTAYEGASGVEGSRTRAERELREKQDFLLNYGSLIDLMFRREEDERAMDTALQVLERHGNAELFQLARTAAMEILNSQTPIENQKALLPQLAEWLQQVQEARASLEKTYQLIGMELGRKLPRAEAGSTYVLEQSVVPTSDFDRYYQEAGLNLAQLATQALKALNEKGQGTFPALDALRQYANDPTGLADLIAAQAAADLMRFFERRANIVQIMHEQKSAGETDAEDLQRLQRQVKLMFDTCQPFWTTYAPRGMSGYESFMAITVPCRSDDPRLTEIRQAVEKVVQEAGYTPELVQTDYPFTLEICARAYGARAYYLSSAADMKTFYESRITQPSVRDMLHVDKRFIGRLPKLHPEPQEQAKFLFAWGLAYGYIAKRGEYYYLSVEYRMLEGRGVPMPKYDSDWEAKIADLMDSSWRGEPQTLPDAEDLIAQGRVQAMQRFSSSVDLVRRLHEVPDQYVQRWGTQRVVQELTTYLSRLDAVTKNARAADQRNQFKTERELIENYIEGLQEHV